MATLYITEFSKFAHDFSGGTVPAPLMPGIAEQAITITGTSAQSAAFSATTTNILVHTDTACFLAFGANPTAVNTAHGVGAGETRFYGVAAGSKIAVRS